MSTEKKPTLCRYGLEITSTDGFKLPVGTTSERKSTALQGLLRFNSDSGQVERYDDSWLNLRNDLAFVAKKSANFNAEINCAYPVNTSSISLVVNAPQNPRAGERFALFDSEGTWASRTVRLQTTGAMRVERQTSLVLDVKNDHVVFVYTGIDGLGWVRENGGYPLVPVYDAIDTKADQTYVDSLYDRGTHPDVTAVENVQKNLIQFSSNTLGFRILLHISKTDGNSEMFEIMATKGGSNVPVFTVSSEIRTGVSDIVFNVDYSDGLRLNITSALAATIRMKVIWNVMG